jgi:Tol biopolymer transport system component
MRMLLALALLTSNGLGVAAEEGAQPSLTPSGRFLVYVQNPDRTPAVPDVFVLDRRTGRRERVSVGPRGQRGKGASFEPSISDDGRFVVFCSYAPNFAAVDQPRRPGSVGSAPFFRDVFIRDRRARTTTMLSVAPDGRAPSGGSCHPAISGNGRFIAFVSDADNLVRGDRDGHMNYFLHDRATRRTIRLPGASAVDSIGSKPGFSRDGRWLAYWTVSTGLVLRDNRTGRSTRISGAGGLSLSADGRYMAGRHDGNGIVRDLATGRVTDLGKADFVSLSADGRVAATLWNERVIVRDLVTGRTAQVDDPAFGGFAWRADFLGGISGDGRIIPFVSSAYVERPAGARRQALFLRVGW